MLIPSVALSECVLYLQRGKSPRYADSGEVRILNQKCIRWGGFDLEHARVWDDKAIASLDEVRFLRVGDVVVNSTGEGTIGRANVWGSVPGRWVVDSHVTIIRPTEDLLGDWLKFWLESPIGQQFVVDSKTGATKQTELSTSKLRGCLIPLPDQSYQKETIDRIKYCFQRLEEMKTLHSEQHALQDQLVRAARRELLGDPYKIPSGWIEPRLDHLADVIYGISEAISANRDSSIGPPIVRMANISKDGQLDLTDLRYCPIPKGKEKHFGLRRGDLLLNWRSGSSDHVGKTAIFDADGLFTCASFILRIRVDNRLANNRYLRHVLNFMRAEGVFSDSTRMQVNHKLNAAEFSAFPIRIPSTFSEQERIADELDAAESIALKLESVEQEQRAQVGELRAAILRKAFAGGL
jgi:type I restriction enzyme S subunit